MCDNKKSPERTYRIPTRNYVSVTGRVVRPMDLIYTPSGKPMLRLTLASNQRWRGENGEWQEKVSFIPILMFGQNAQKVAERMSRGMPLDVEGRLQSSQWTDKGGNTRYGMDIVTSRVQILETPASSEMAQAWFSQNAEDF